jgi:glutamate-1-semialdehyde 2,1-aminomutase
MQYSDSDRFEYWIRAQDCIAQGALTNSKNPNSHVLGVYPTHATRGNGAYLYDTMGNRYVDYICGLGVNLLGYNFPPVVDAVKGAAQHGFSHSLPTVYEVLAAEALKEVFVFVDKWKFLKSGSEACSAAIRMARAYSGRDLVLSNHYHGWSDDFVSLTEPARGVPKRSFIRKLDSDNDLSNVAAVIIEPVTDEWNDERIRYLHDLREKCTKAGALLIFDEVVTALRFKNNSVAAAAGVIPDLIVIGKTIAQGMPLAAVGGKRAVMDGDYFVSTTYAGEICSLNACIATLNTLQKNPFYRLERLWEAGERFITKFNKIAAPYVQLKAYPTRGVFTGEPLNKALLFQEACKAGILLCNSWFYNFPLMEQDEFFFNFLTDFKRRMDLAEIVLEGEMPKSPFSQRVRDAGKN